MIITKRFFKITIIIIIKIRIMIITKSFIITIIIIIKIKIMIITKSCLSNVIDDVLSPRESLNFAKMQSLVASPSPWPMQQHVII